MSDAAEHKQWLGKTTYGLLKRFSKWRRWVKVGFLIGGALIVSGAGIATNFVDPAVKLLLYVVQLVGVLMVFVGGVLMEFLDEGAVEAIQRANALVDAVEDRDNDIASLEKDFEWMTRLYASAGALRDIVERVIASGPGTADDRNRRLAAMLDVLVSDKVVLLGMSSDRWNFAIYLENTEGSLECVACRRPIRAEEEAPHRSWRPGEGHVGIAFQAEREIVAGDTSESEAQALFDAPDGLRRGDDRERYRSIASIPIRLTGEKPVGILVATSDVAQRFRLRQSDDAAAPDSVEPLRVLAKALALVIKAANLYDEGNARHGT